MKKAILLLSFFLTFQLLHAQTTSYIRGTNVAVRVCPDVSCQSISVGNTNDVCEVLSVDKEERIEGYGFNYWYKVRIKGQEGFIYGAFIEFTKSTISSTPSGSSQIHAGIVTGDDVNIRVADDMFSLSLFKLNKGNNVKIIGHSKGYFIDGLGTYPWYKIDYLGKEGFIYGAFVDCPSCGTNIKREYGTITGDNVNIRAKNQISNNILFALNRGDKCIIKQKLPKENLPSIGSYHWYEIDYNGTTGYVFGKYLSIGKSNIQDVKIWAVVVGIANYSPIMNAIGAGNLNYSNDDAQNIYNFLKSPQGGNLPDHQIQLLTDYDATQSNILKATTAIYQQARPQDLIIFYFSGHGGPNYFVAYDTPIKHADIKASLEQSQAQKRLCVADACYSGTWSSNAKAQANQKSLNTNQLEQLYYNALANSKNGVAYFMSSQKDETSIEDSHLKQGVFTYYYIKGLKGDADADQNNIVTIKELFDYVSKHVSSYALFNYKHLQHPQLRGSFDKNMPISAFN